MRKFLKSLAWAILIVGLVLGVSYFFAGKDYSEKQQVAQVLGNNHEKMLALLQFVSKKENKPENGYAGEVKLAFCDSMLRISPDPQAQLNYKVQKGNILLELGRESQAVEIFEQVYDYAKSIPSTRIELANLLGLAYLRLAERTNCVTGHNSDACIMPIRGGGVHMNKEPARKAVEMFESVLKEKPDDLDARWLLNIAYMTLGEYPTGVPKPWLIEGLDKEGSMKVKPFTEIATDLGIDINNRSGGVIVEDFNNDGYLDIVTSAWGLDDPMHYYRNNTDGTFTDVSAASGLKAIGGGLNLLQTDYNNDGWIDVFVLRGAWQGVSGFGEQPNSLLRNNGDGTFTDVTFDAGLVTLRPTQTATWNDFNNDGWLDLFVGNETTEANLHYPSEFFINNKNGTFTNLAGQEELNINLFVKGVSSGDFDNDGWADIFLSCLSGEKILLRNEGFPGGKPKFEDVSQKVGLPQDKGGTFPTFFFDYDNDGWLDLFMCNYDFDRPLSYYSAKEAIKPSADQDGKIQIYHNNGKNAAGATTFSLVSPKMQLNQTVFAMGSNFGDIDNDGWLDMYLSTGNPSYKSLIPNRMYKNLGGVDFVEVTNSARVGHLQKGHGVAFADLNNNGDQDLYVDMGGAFLGDAYHSSFYLNPGQNDNNWICMKLIGNRSNKAAIGARVAVKFKENGVERVVYRDVNSGGSFGASPLRREIGVGQATMIDEISIFWPATKITQVIKNVKPNQFIQVTEGKDGFEKITLKNLTFKLKNGAIPMCAPKKEL